MGLAVLGGAAYRDRWVGFWVLLAGIGGVLMLGRFTFLFDHAHRVPIAGSSRIPVRFHLWVALAVAALAGVGVDRLSRPGAVRLRAAAVAMGLLVLVSIPILIVIYTPAWTQSQRWPMPDQLARFHWLGRELLVAAVRTSGLVALGCLIVALAARTANLRLRSRLAVLMPLLVMSDLLGAHADDVPTITPEYWTVPPETAQLLKANPACIRVFGIAERASGEPGYASEPVDFLAYRDPLGWSLPPVWGLASSGGETPIIPRRYLTYTDHARPGRGRYDIEGVTHLLTGRGLASALGPSDHVGTAYIHWNPGALPRARLMGRPYYVPDEAGAIAALDGLGPEIRRRLVVEDPDVPMPETTIATGQATIVREVPERVEVRTESPGDAYLVLADAFDPGWSATRDGRPVPIRPAWVAFRAVFVPKGTHTVIFRYRPAGFIRGLAVTGCGLALTIFCLAWPRRLPLLGPEHGVLNWPHRWPLWELTAIVVIVLASIFTVTRSGLAIQNRWSQSFHRFTWGAGIEAMRIQPPAAP
jgi:hypothetical protein